MLHIYMCLEVLLSPPVKYHANDERCAANDVRVTENPLLILPYVEKDGNRYVAYMHCKAVGPPPDYPKGITIYPSVPL